MRWRRSFRSRIEQRIALPVVLMLSGLVLGITYLAMEQIRQQTLHHAERNLQRIAKDYGMLLAERLKDRSTYEQFWDHGPKPALHWDGADTLIIEGERNGEQRRQQISLPFLTRDIDLISDVTRCVAVNDTPACTSQYPGDLVRIWDLRLVSLFNTDLVISTGVAQAPEDALGNIDLVVSIMPYVTALIAAIMGYGVVLYLRRRFRPVPELKQAIRNIEGGDFFSTVKIDSGDEFADLGNAINALSHALGGSFGFLNRLSEIDELILANTDKSQVVRAIVETAVEFAGTTSALVAEQDGDEHYQIRGILQGNAFEARIPESQISGAGTAQLPFLADATLLPVLRERETSGWLIFGPEADMERMGELARKTSAGITSISRSQSLFQQATYDGLTGLYNRVAFLNLLNQHLNSAQRQDNEGALLFIDLDDFKTINDVQGHGTGDRLLCIIANRLSGCVRSGDRIARLGGDEFAICLNHLEDQTTLTSLLQRIISEISTPVQIGQFQHIVNCSIGVCLFPNDGEDSETLLKNADLAMYRAKAISGSAYTFFDASLNEESHRRMLVEQRLRKAMDANQLQLHLQPKMYLQNRRVSSAEALVRWTDEELGFVSPAEFIDVAERAGLIERLTDCVIGMAADALRLLPTLSRVAINVSPLQLAQPHFAQAFLQTLKDHEVDPNRVEVEVTETVFVSNPEAVTEKLSHLQGHGIRVSLDDFGTGYSSLNLLRQLPLNALKIDKSFVDDIPDDDQATLLVGKIIEIAMGMGIEVIAEGVETNAQLGMLEQLQCSTVQGYLLCRPIPVGEFAEFLEQHDLANIGLTAVG